MSDESTSYDYKNAKIITKEECMNILRKTTGCEKVNLVKFELEGIQGHTGYLGEYLDLKIHYSENKKIKEKQYFIKMLPLFCESQRKVLLETKIFIKETWIYSRIFSVLNNGEGQFKWHPNCYLARDDLLVLEDLKLNNYALLPFKYEWKECHINEVLKTIAKLHSAAFDYEINHLNEKRLDEEFDVFFETSVKKDDTWFLAGLSGICAVALNKTKFKSDPKVKTDLMGQLYRIFELIKPTKEFRSTLVHRDLWTNNIMFQFDLNKDGNFDFEHPNHCLLVDFQVCRYLPPAVDVLIAIYLLLRRAQRELQFQKYTNLYYKNLTKELEKFNLNIDHVLPFEEYEKTLKHYKLIPLVFTCVFFSLIHLPPGVVDGLKRNHPEEYDKFCNENRDDVILEYFEKDNFYKETLLESVEETLEYIFSLS